MRINGNQQVDIPLDIAVDYPINWSFRQALRDLIQNFYDAIGTDRFGSDFLYEYNYDRKRNIYRLDMKAKTDAFSYELLSYIGATTKKDDGKTIGKYGEGFKMAALAIYQEHRKMSLKMHAGDWIITPNTYSIEIDNKTVEMFGYDLDTAEDDGLVTLTIEGIPHYHAKALEEALYEFFYPDNKLFGNLIGRGDSYGVYHMGKLPIPCDDRDPELKGILFINNIARGRLPIPIAVNYTSSGIKKDARSRPTLNSFRTTEYLYRCMELWDAKTSAAVLRIMKHYWSEIPVGLNNVHTKYYYICQLVRNISKDDQVSKEFSKEMKRYCYFERKTMDNVRNARIDEARKWYSEHGKKIPINPIFRLLGAENVVESYIRERDSRYRAATDKEQHKYQLITECIVDISGLLDENDIPQLCIALSDEEKTVPLQFASKIMKKKEKLGGRKYRINKLVLLKKDFERDAFDTAFTKVSEALLQIYGTNKCAIYNAVYTDWGGCVLKNLARIDEARSKWKEGEE